MTTVPVPLALASARADKVPPPVLVTVPPLLKLTLRTAVSVNELALLQLMASLTFRSPLPATAPWVEEMVMLLLPSRLLTCEPVISPPLAAMV
ncbi:hypothetical protein A203_17960 [Chromobacterium violaceum]